MFKQWEESLWPELSRFPDAERRKSALRRAKEKAGRDWRVWGSRVLLSIIGIYFVPKLLRHLGFFFSAPGPQTHLIFIGTAVIYIFGAASLELLISRRQVRRSL